MPLSASHCALPRAATEKKPGLAAATSARPSGLRVRNLHPQFNGQRLYLTPLRPTFVWSPNGTTTTRGSDISLVNRRFRSQSCRGISCPVGADGRVLGTSLSCRISRSVLERTRTRGRPHLPYRGAGVGGGDDRAHHLGSIVRAARAALAPSSERALIATIAADASADVRPDEAPSSLSMIAADAPRPGD